MGFAQEPEVLLFDHDVSEIMVNGDGAVDVVVVDEDARRVLMEDVVLSEAMAKQEVDRYTFRAPGQATSYFVRLPDPYRIDSLQSRTSVTTKFVSSWYSRTM